MYLSLYISYNKFLARGKKTSSKGNNKEGGFATQQRKLISSQMWLIFLHVNKPTH